MRDTHSLESAAVWAVVRPRVLPSIFLRVNVRSFQAKHCVAVFRVVVAGRYLVCRFN